MEGTFVGHEGVNGTMKAKFMEEDSEVYLLDKVTCDLNLNRLLQQGLRHDETQKALDTWPE